jgi:hypothetical protein
VIMFLLVCSLLSWSPLSFVVMLKNDNICSIINEDETSHYWSMVQNLFKTKNITRSLFLLSKLHTLCMEEETSTKKFILDVKEVTTLLRTLGEIVYEKNCSACHMCWMHCLLIRRDSFSPSLEKSATFFWLISCQTSTWKVATKIKVPKKH